MDALIEMEKICNPKIKKDKATCKSCKGKVKRLTHLKFDNGGIKRTYKEYLQNKHTPNKN